MLYINQTAPNFLLQDQNGKSHSLTNYLGSWVLIYFYPKDNTPGCTKEACAIRDSWELFEKNKIVVLGISGDSVASHQKFTSKFNLPFTLLSDQKKTVINKYQALGKKNMFGKTYIGIKRVSYLINSKGLIVKVYPKVKPNEHAQEILKDVLDLK